MPPRELTAQPNQEGSEDRPLDHMYLRKGSTYQEEVNFWLYYIATLFPQECAQTTFFP